MVHPPAIDNDSCVHRDLRPHCENSDRWSPANAVLPDRLVGLELFRASAARHFQCVSWQRPSLRKGLFPPFGGSFIVSHLKLHRIRPTAWYAALFLDLF